MKPITSIYELQEEMRRLHNRRKWQLRALNLSLLIVTAAGVIATLIGLR